MMQPPRLGVEPEIMVRAVNPGASSATSSRPTSRSNRPRANSLGGSGGAYAHVASSNYAQRNHPVGGTSFGGHQPLQQPLAIRGGNGNSGGGTVVVASQERLIQNLKQQIDVLQHDLSAARGGGGLELPPAGSPATHAVIPLRGSRSPARAGSDERGGGAGGSAPLASAAERVGAGLTSEVQLLRLRHADMEREFRENTAELRRKLEEAHTLLLEADVIDPRSLSGPKLLRRNPNDARQRIAADKREREHSMEVVELQKEVARLKSELELREAEAVALRREKGAIVDDLVAAKDVGRAATNDATIAARQLNETRQQLRLEQEQRHTLEDKLNALQRGAVTETQGANEAYETKIRALTAQLSVARCEAESAKMSENKWRSEIEAIASQNAELARAAEVARDHAAATDRRLKDTQARLDDCDAQREFLQLTVDRMRVEETSSTARTSQLEQILKAEREQGRELEKSFNRALEEKESLMRVTRQREADQQRRDVEETKIRAQAKYAIDTADALRNENALLRHQVADLTRKLETGMDMARSQAALAEALRRMEDAKSEMTGIMNKQIRVAKDVSECIAAMPRGAVHQSPESHAAATFLSHAAESSSPVAKQH